MVEVELPNPLPRRLNVGCGFDIRPGFLNVDFQEHHKPDLVADVTSLPMLPSDYFEEVVAQDVLEHFERARTAGALREWARLLSPTGVLFIRVPSLLHMADLLLAAEREGPDAAAAIVHLFYGTQAYNGDYHLAGFTAATLRRQFSEAGLVAREVHLRGAWLFEVYATKGVGAGAAWPLARVQEREQGALYQNEVEALRAEVASLRDAVAAERQRGAALQAEVETMRRSTSWAVTAPMRALKRRLG